MGRRRQADLVALLQLQRCVPADRITVDLCAVEASQIANVDAATFRDGKLVLSGNASRSKGMSASRLRPTTNRPGLGLVQRPACPREEEKPWLFLLYVVHRR